MKLNLTIGELADLGRPNIDKRLEAIQLTGARLMVLRDESVREFGKLVIPDSVRAKEMPGAGIVVAVGPDVGIMTQPYPGGIALASPTMLLGAHVFFGQWSGKQFRLDILDSEWRGAREESDLLVMTDRDLWAWEAGTLGRYYNEKHVTNQGNWDHSKDRT